MSFIELSSMTVSWEHTDHEWWQTLHWAHLTEDQTQPVPGGKTEPRHESGSISHWLSDLPQEQPWQDFICHASLCFLPHPSLSLFGNVMDHLESQVWALEVHAAPGYCACFNSCILMWKIILSQTTRSLVLGAHHVPNPQANLKITALLGCYLLDFNESSPAWSHEELEWVWRQKVAKDCRYLLISSDEERLERSKRNDNAWLGALVAYCS